MRFAGKNVLITGAATGVGRTLSIAFAREGADIAILDTNDAALTRAAVEGEGRRCAVFQADIRREDQVERSVAGAADIFDGRIDILINNAGVAGHYNLVRNMPLDKWRETIDINLTGTMLVTKAVLPYMIARKSGAIGTNASNVARRGLAHRADYVCTKWALLGFNQTIALELAEYNIRANAVCPGPIEGDRIEMAIARHAAAEGKEPSEVRRAWEAASPMKRFVTPEEVSDVLLFLCSEAASAITGQAVNVTAGFLMN